MHKAAAWHIAYRHIQAPVPPCCGYRQQPSHEVGALCVSPMGIWHAALPAARPAPRQHATPGARLTRGRRAADESVEQAEVLQVANKQHKQSNTHGRGHGHAEEGGAGTGNPAAAVQGQQQRTCCAVRAAGFACSLLCRRSDLQPIDSTLHSTQPGFGGTMQLLCVLGGEEGDIRRAVHTPPTSGTGPGPGPGSS